HVGELGSGILVGRDRDHFRAAIARLENIVDVGNVPVCGIRKSDDRISEEPSLDSRRVLELPEGQVLAGVEITDEKVEIEADSPQARDEAGRRTLAAAAQHAGAVGSVVVS